MYILWVVVYMSYGSYGLTHTMESCVHLLILITLMKVVAVAAANCLGNLMSVVGMGNAFVKGK